MLKIFGLFVTVLILIVISESPLTIIQGNSSELIASEKKQQSSYSELSGGQVVMGISTFGMMVVAHAGGGMDQSQFNFLAELVSLYQDQDKEHISKNLIKQYDYLIAKATDEELKGLFMSGRELSIETRREILVSCLAMAMFNGQPNDKQFILISTFFRWLDVSIDETKLLLEKAKRKLNS
ncbi:MAG: hypothetical protein GY797_34450 [Deltaproteobacteria bacterium]|nr:hypothetical protein [Deltaproteobacteria bacterium]